MDKEKEKGQEMVLRRNVPELKQDIRHIEAKQVKGRTIRSGIAKSRTIRSGKNESRNTGSHWEDHLQQCHLLQCLAPILAVPKCNNDLYLSVVFLLMLLL